MLRRYFRFWPCRDLPNTNVLSHTPIKSIWSFCQENKMIRLLFLYGTILILGSKPASATYTNTRRGLVEVILKDGSKKLGTTIFQLNTDDIDSYSYRMMMRGIGGILVIKNDGLHEFIWHTRHVPSSKIVTRSERGLDLIGVGLWDKGLSLARIPPAPSCKPVDSGYFWETEQIPLDKIREFTLFNIEPDERLKSIAASYGAFTCKIITWSWPKSDESINRSFLDPKKLPNTSPEALSNAISITEKLGHWLSQDKNDNTVKPPATSKDDVEDALNRPVILPPTFKMIGLQMIQAMHKADRSKGKSLYHSAREILQQAEVYQDEGGPEVEGSGDYAEEWVSSPRGASDSYTEEQDQMLIELVKTELQLRHFIAQRDNIRLKDMINSLSSDHLNSLYQEWSKVQYIPGIALLERLVWGRRDFNWDPKRELNRFSADLGLPEFIHFLRSFDDCMEAKPKDRGTVCSLIIELIASLPSKVHQSNVSKWMCHGGIEKQKMIVDHKLVYPPLNPSCFPQEAGDALEDKSNEFKKWLRELRDQLRSAVLNRSKPDIHTLLIQALPCYDKRDKSECSQLIRQIKNNQKLINDPRLLQLFDDRGLLLDSTNKNSTDEAPQPMPSSSALAIPRGPYTFYDAGGAIVFFGKVTKASVK